MNIKAHKNNGHKEGGLVNSKGKALNHQNFAIVSGRTNHSLVSGIGEYIGVEPVFFDTEPWGNGYPRCVRPDGVTFKGKQVFIVTSLQYTGIGSPLEELKQIYSSCANAEEIYIILSWFCTKDDIDHSDGHDPNAVSIAREIANLGPKSIYCFDLHQSSHLGFFSPCYRRRFYLLSLLIEKAKEMGIDQVSATDWGSSPRAIKVSTLLGLKTPIVLAAKEHDHRVENSLSRQQFFGEVVGQNIGLFDDMALTLGTLKGGCKSLRQQTNKGIYAFAPHFDPAPGKTYDNLKEAFNKGWLTAFVTTNSNPIPQEFLDFGPEKFIVVDASGYFGDLITSVVNDEPSSEYFRDY